MIDNKLVRILISLFFCLTFLAIPAENVNAVALSVTSINPDSGKQGQTIASTITGTGFTGAARVRIKDGGDNDIVYAYLSSTPPGFTIVSDTQISISFTISAGATPGPGDVRVYISGTWYYLDNGFTVLGPYISNFNPQNAKQGQTLSVVLSGGGFTGATAVSFSGTGVTVTGFTVNSDAQITAAVTIAADAALEHRHISVTTPTGTGTNSSSFYVFAASSPGWVLESVDPISCETVSIAIDSDNHPHISYYDSNNADLKYASYNGSTWTKVTVDSTGSVGLYSSLKLDSGGNPCIGYWDETNGDLKYARWTGSAWQTMVVDDGTTPYGVGYDGISLAMDSAGHPHIVYYDYTNNTLKYASNSSAPFNPASWVTGAIPDVVSGRNCSLALDGSGNAHVSYSQYYAYNIWYVYQSAGTWQTPEQVGTYRSQIPSIALDSGNVPHIMYKDVSSGVVTYISRTGGTWGTPQDAADTGTTGGNAPLVLDGAGHPHTFFQGYWGNPSTQGVRYTAYDGSTWPTTPQVVEGGNFFQLVSLALDGNGSPHVAYSLNSSTYALMYAHYAGTVAPTITAVSPNTGSQGQTLSSVVITGTNFTNPSTVSFSGTGITVNSVSFGSATQLTANITVSGTAATGARDVTVTITGSGTGTKTGGFTVTVAPRPTQSVPTATGTGTATFTTSSGSLTGLTPSTSTNCGTLTSLPGYNFPHGFFTYNVTGITAGSTVTITITLPSAIPIGTKYWKCINNQWVDVTSIMGDDDGDNILTLAIKDGGLGDADGLVNGAILDPGGPAGVASGTSFSTNTSVATNSSSSAPSLPERFMSSPAKLSVKYLDVQPLQAQANQPVTISANMANGGDDSGTYTATLKINGQVEQTKTGRVGGRIAVPLKFEVLRDKPGTYNVDINGQQASFTIVGGAGNSTDTSKSIPILGFIICAIGVIIVSVLLIQRRRTQY